MGNIKDELEKRTYSELSDEELLDLYQAIKEEMEDRQEKWK